MRSPTPSWLLLEPVLVTRVGGKHAALELQTGASFGPRSELGKHRAGYIAAIGFVTTFGRQ